MSPVLFINLIATFLIAASQADELVNDGPKLSYKNYKLIRIYPDSEETVRYLNTLYDGSSPYELDFWQPPTHVGAIVDVTVAPSDAPIFVKDLESKKLNYVVVVNDLQQAIEGEKSSPGFYHPEADGYSYNKYNSLEDIHKELLRLRKEKPEMISLIDIGESHENRTLLVAKVSGHKSAIEQKISMWLDAGIHAREWIAPATAMYILRELVSGYESDPSIQKLLDHIDFYILPVMNPDGYEYSREKNRMWRKNRRPATCKRQHFHTVCCAGVDLNRNFEWFWSSSGSSTDPCHDTYHGPSAFSEPETVAVRDFVEANKPEAFITLHSYSQMWLVPYGHRKRSYPQDYHTALLPLAQKATKALYDVFGTKYQVGTGADLMYEASGGSHDWAKGVLKVNYAYLIELRPQNTAAGFGFLLPEREIPATGLETFEAIKVVAEEMVAQFVEPEIRRRVRPTPPPLPKRRGYKIVSTIKQSVTGGIASTTPAATTAMPTLTTAEETTVPATTTIPMELSSPSTTATSKSSIKICVDFGNYCRLWAVLNLCGRPSVASMCARSCRRLNCQL